MTRCFSTRQMSMARPRENRRYRKRWRVERCRIVTTTKFIPCIHLYEIGSKQEQINSWTPNSSMLMPCIPLIIPAMDDLFTELFFFGAILEPKLQVRDWNLTIGAWKSIHRHHIPKRLKCHDEIPMKFQPKDKVQCHGLQTQWRWKLH